MLLATTALRHRKETVAIYDGILRGPRLPSSDSASFISYGARQLADTTIHTQTWIVYALVDPASVLSPR